MTTVVRRCVQCVSAAIVFAAITAVAQTRIAVPSYQDPGSPQWNSWIAPGRSSIGIMIVNENNGDDLTYYPSVALAIQRAQQNGIFVVGYVYTGYGKRNPAIVEKDIDGVFKNYNVNGIFFDEVPTDCGAATPALGTTYRYYQTVANHVRSRHVGRIVILNPGTQPPNDCWMSIANILVSAESSSLQDYTTNYQDQAWFHLYPPSRFWHIVYNVAGSAQLNKVLLMSHQRGAGWVYVTDGGSANPYAQPPAYWKQETSEIAAQDVQDPYATFRPASQDENGNPVAARVSIRWTASARTDWNVFIDTDRRSGTSYYPKSGPLSISPDYLLQVHADGKASLFHYSGDGTDWRWAEVDSNSTSYLLDSNTILAEADAAAFGGASSLQYQIQELTGTRFIAMPQHLSLTNTGFLSDIQNH